MDVPQTTSSLQSLAWAIEQLQHCKRSHKLCGSYPDSPLPRRVLDVYAPAGSSGVRLYESEGESAPYVCLSHCWGRKPFLRTLSGSLEAHRDEVVWSRLPPTFQDAIEFTRKLGIRYLWIDSLCIVQDDQQDWRREAAKMASIYQNSALVISAAKSPGAYGGLYADLPPRHKIHTVTVTVTPERAESSRTTPTSPFEASEPAPQTETVHVRLGLTHPQRLFSPYHAQPSTLPVFTRGWILQERFLSPRMLHFGPEELTWECVETRTCQCSPAPPGSESDHHHPGAASAAPAWYRNMVDRSARPKRYYSPAMWMAGDMPRSELQVCWRRLVEDYTRLALTFERDVFPAVSGMARAMHGARYGSHSESSSSPPAGPDAGAEDKHEEASYQNEYVAGLWRDSLLAGDLLWHVTEPPAGYLTSKAGEGDPPSAAAATDGTSTNDETGARREEPWMERPSAWRAPSWSWAAVKQPVEFINLHEGMEAECEVMDVRCEPAGEDPRGELREGGSWLVMKGRLVPAVLGLRDHEPGTKLHPWNLIQLDILKGHMCNLWADDGCRGLVGATVYCLYLGRKLPMKEPLFLLLARAAENSNQDKSPDEDPHLYRRIGLLEITGGRPTNRPWGWLHDLLGKGEDAAVRII